MSTPFKLFAFKPALLRALAGETERAALKLSPTDVAEYLIQDALPAGDDVMPSGDGAPSTCGVDRGARPRAVRSEVGRGSELVDLHRDQVFNPAIEML